MATFIGLSNFDEIGKSQRQVSISTRRIHQEILRRTGKERPNVLYIPTARGDREDYIAFFTQYYSDLGAHQVDVLRLRKHPPSRKVIEEKIFSADAIYVNGGNTFGMLRIWERLGVDKLLQRAHRQGIVVAGHSAGTVCWFAYACSDSFYKQKPIKLTGMGVFNAVLCPHYDSETVRQPALKKIMKRTPRLVALALDDAVAIEIVDGRYRLLNGTPPGKARRAFWHNGRYVIEELPVGGAFGSLSDLLAKPE